MSKRERQEHGICDNAECTRSFVDVPTGDAFVCPDCGTPLRSVGGGRKKSKTGLVIAIIAGVLLLLGGAFAAWYFLLKDKKADVKDLEDTEEVVEQLGDDTEEPLINIEEEEDEIPFADGDDELFGDNDTIVAAEPAKPQEVVAQPEPAKKNDTVKKDTPKKSNGVKTSNGNYTGAMQGGQPHGMGKFVFSRSMSIPLNDGMGTVLQVVAGDRVENAKFVDGKLRSGHFVFTDGRAPKDVLGINQKL